jgi:hypothetical protein
LGGELMKLIADSKPKMIVADEGKYIRGVEDVYVLEHIDDEGKLVPEHFPYYTTTIFVPDSFTEEKMNELYVEETNKDIEREEK